VVERWPALQHALNRNAIVDGDTYFMHAAVSAFVAMHRNTHTELYSHVRVCGCPFCFVVCF
jgi:hypothetical protein